MRLSDRKNKRFFYISIFFIVVILYLCLVDAYAYTLCEHIGVCEFLELESTYDVDKKTIQYIMALHSKPFKIKLDLHFISHILPELKESEYRLVSVQNFCFLFSLYMFSRCINPHPQQSGIYLSLAEDAMPPVDQKYSSLSINRSFSAKALQIITTSIIRS